MIYPEGHEVVADSEPLTVSKTKQSEMVTKAKELLTEPMEYKVLMDALEQHYVALNEHYTSAQLKKVIDQVQSDLKPEVEEQVEEG